MVDCRMPMVPVNAIKCFRHFFSFGDLRTVTEPSGMSVALLQAGSGGRYKTGSDKLYKYVCLTIYDY
jgi:hypothetical protein